MTRWTSLLLVLALAGMTAGARASQDDRDESAALRGRIEARYDVVPLTDGIALRPKARTGDLRLIEISEGIIAINGVPVTGRELRERAGSDADTILRLSYLSSDQRRALFADPEPPRAGARPENRNGARQPMQGRDPRRSGRERVRIFGDVVVDEDETIEGQVVAVLGSVRVNGEVGNEVVAVLGSVDLGPKAVVRGDVVSIGGRVRRAAGAQIRGGVTEVSIGGATRHLSVGPWFGPGDIDFGFDGLPRLLGSTARLLLLVLLGGVALVFARGSVERSAERVAENPPKAMLVGLTAGLLAAPVFVLTAFVLVITLIGIPLLLLLPFAAIWLLLLALVGFTGTACVVGQAVRRRVGIASGGAFLNVCFGLLAIVSPLLIGRLLGVASWDNPISWLLVFIGTALEFLAWTTGFGAVLMNTFTRWRARRIARTAAPVPAA